MANEMPPSSDFSGLSRKVIEYSEHFKRISDKLKSTSDLSAEWAAMEKLVDTANFRREGVFLTSKSESFGWDVYKDYVTKFGAGVVWEGTLRRITEVPGLVFLELEERNSHSGTTNISNTVTIYKFNDAGKLAALDVYVSDKTP